MKKIYFLICFHGFISFNNNAYSQNISKDIDIKQIDSLLRSKIDESKIDEFGKISSAETKPRGINPCEDDYDYLVMLFKSLKTNYLACCNGTTNYPAVSRILSSIYSIINNPKCKWGVSQWLVFTYYLGDYTSFVDKYKNCCSK